MPTDTPGARGEPSFSGKIPNRHAKLRRMWGMSSWFDWLRGMPKPPPPEGPTVRHGGPRRRRENAAPTRMLPLPARPPSTWATFRRLIKDPWHAFSILKQAMRVQPLRRPISEFKQVVQKPARQTVPALPTAPAWPSEPEKYVPAEVTHTDPRATVAKLPNEEAMRAVQKPLEEAPARGPGPNVDGRLAGEVAWRVWCCTNLSQLTGAQLMEHIDAGPDAPPNGWAQAAAELYPRHADLYGLAIQSKRATQLADLRDNLEKLTKWTAYYKNRAPVLRPWTESDGPAQLDGLRATVSDLLGEAETQRDKHEAGLKGTLKTRYAAAAAPRYVPADEGVRQELGNAARSYFLNAPQEERGVLAKNRIWRQVCSWVVPAMGWQHNVIDKNAWRARNQGASTPARVVALLLGNEPLDPDSVEHIHGEPWNCFRYKHGNGERLFVAHNPQRDAWSLLFYTYTHVNRRDGSFSKEYTQKLQQAFARLKHQLEKPSVAHDV